MENKKLENLTINTIRTLAMDSVQNAGSGHPGTAMSLAPAAFVLWDKIMNYNPANPSWLNRDRFVLSNGHAAIIQYIMLHLSGYELSLDDLKSYRQYGSKTPGHPEYGWTHGIETTTGPLGQGFMTATGMAMAEAHLAEKFNKEGFQVIDHYTYGFCSDGDLMEGASHEAASIAGNLGLGKLIFLYDDNHISIDGKTEFTYSDDVKKRFEAYGWHVQDLGDNANDTELITKAYRNAQEMTSRPSLIILRTHIAWGAPNMQDNPSAHGSPLGDEEVKKTKEAYGWPSDKTFYVPDEVRGYMRNAVERGKNAEEKWKELYESYRKKHQKEAENFEDGLYLKLEKDWDKDFPEFTPDDGPLATRKASSKVIEAFTKKIPYILGGSADLASSTKTLFGDSEYISKGTYSNRNIAWGIREHAMCAASSGITLHGGLRAFAATFFIFSDYARPAIRLSALMEIPTIYVFTHDSIGLGGDGPTHQPVEHLASFRAMPHMYVFRPGDANEVSWAWRAILQRKEGPSMIILTRQNVEILDRSKYADASGVMKGAYVLAREEGEQADLILIATGSEVPLAIKAREELKKQDVDARVVSMPCWEVFRKQPEEYQQEVLPPGVTSRMAIEAASPFGWEEWIGEKGKVIGVERFGASGEYKDNFRHYGFTVDNVVEKAKELIQIRQL